LDQSLNSPHHFKFVLAPGQSIPTKLLEKHLEFYEKRVGNKVELGIYGLAIIQQISEILSTRSGACLIIDYGQEKKTKYTLRGIYKHKFVNVLEKPGEVDLSVDVDWDEIKRQVHYKPDLRTFGPQTQRNFLKMLGIDVRLSTLLRNPALTEEQAEVLLAAYQRLTEDMGDIYRALCIVDEKTAAKLNNSIPGFEALDEQPK
jgi:NADH dehydrogenase [ubiquinone] 1 alpha subcomplex assembly factor 7